MTAAHVVARTAKGRNFTLSLFADKVLEMKGYNAHTAYANGTCSGTGDFDLYYRGEVHISIPLPTLPILPISTTAARCISLYRYLHYLYYRSLLPRRGARCLYAMRV
jgi:hypothetical protein